MIDDRFLHLTEDTSALPQVDLTRMTHGDKLLVQTRRSLYELVLHELNTENDPPLWLARVRGDRWVKAAYYFVVGANTAFFRLRVGSEILRSALKQNLLIQGFPMVLVDLHDGAVALGPVEHTWRDRTPLF